MAFFYIYPVMQMTRPAKARRFLEKEVGLPPWAAENEAMKALAQSKRDTAYRFRGKSVRRRLAQAGKEKSAEA